MLKRNALFEELVPVRKAEYDRWRIKTQFREHNPIYSQLLQVHDDLMSLKDRTDLSYEEKLRLDGVLRNQQAALRSNLSPTDPFFMRAPEAAASAPTTAAAALPAAVPDATAKPAKDEEEALAEPAKMPPLEGEVRTFDDAIGRAAELDIPAPMQAECDAVIKAISARPDILSVNENNEIIVDGNAIPNTSATDLIQSLYWRPRGQNRRGAIPFMRALGRIDVPASLILDVVAQREYSRTTGVKPSPRKKRGKKSVGPPAQTGQGSAGFLSVVTKKRRDPAVAKRSSGVPPGKRIRVLRLYK